MVLGPGLEPGRTRQRSLKPPCLPIPTIPAKWCSRRDSNAQRSHALRVPALPFAVIPREQSGGPRGNRTLLSWLRTKRTNRYSIGPKWCSRQGSNLHAFRQRLLRPSCLPIPSPEQKMVRRARLELASRSGTFSRYWVYRFPHPRIKLESPIGLEPMTSSLPRTCSTN